MARPSIMDLSRKPRDLERDKQHAPWPIPDLIELYASTAQPDKPYPESTVGPTTGKIASGRRNSTIASNAGAMRRKGMTEAEMTPSLLKVNENRCEPPLAEPEIHAIVKSIARYKPEDVPRDSELSAKYGDGVAAERKLRFLTAKEMANSTREEVEYVARPFVAKGAITDITAKPKAGKTTLLSHLIANVLDGKPFLGRPTMRTGVVYLTEQSPSTFLEVLKRVALTGREDLVILPWADTIGMKWDDVVEKAVEKAESTGAGLLIVDTLPQFAGMKGDSENNSGAALEAIRPLQEAAAKGMAVITVRHERKSGGEVGDSGRGSSAFAGAADVVLSVRRREGNDDPRPKVRVIHALSRFDETPDKLVVELTEKGYVALGDETALAAVEAKDAIMEVIPTTEEAAMTLGDLVQETKKKRTMVQGAIQELVDKGKALKTGSGRKGSPYRYWRPSSATDDT